MTDVSSVLRVMKELQRTVGPAELNALKQRLDRAETKLDKAEAKLEAEQTKHVATRNQLKETQARNESNFLFSGLGTGDLPGGGFRWGRVPEGEGGAGSLFRGDSCNEAFFVPFHSGLIRFIPVMSTG